MLECKRSFFFFFFFFQILHLISLNLSFYCQTIHIKLQIILLLRLDRYLNDLGFKGKLSFVQEILHKCGTKKNFVKNL